LAKYATAKTVFDLQKKAKKHEFDEDSEQEFLSRRLKYTETEEVLEDLQNQVHVAKQVIKIKAGIEAELAKKITKLIKDSKLKVNASIQGEEVRIQGAKRDDLQAAMALMKKEITDAPLSFDNFRD
jgi:uncharacterized protein YajQ (UPF0234 family)